MAAENPPYVMQDQSHGAELFRLASSSTLSGAGVVQAGDLEVTAAASGMNVNVAAGQVWIPGTEGAAAGVPSWVTSQGSYYCYNDDVVELAITPADQTNARIDYVVATVEDSAFSGASDQWVLQVVTGTPSATPSAPSVPSSSIILAEIAVAAGVTSLEAGNINDLRPLLQLNRPTRGRPAGVCWQGSGSTTKSFTPAEMRDQGLMVNGMQNSNAGIVVPREGVYRCVGQMEVTVTSSDTPAWLCTTIQVTPADGSATYTPPSGVGNRSSLTVTGSLAADVDSLVYLQAGDLVQVAPGASSQMANYTDQAGGTRCWLYVILEVDLT